MSVRISVTATVYSFFAGRHHERDLGQRRALTCAREALTTMRALLDFVSTPRSPAGIQGETVETL